MTNPFHARIIDLSVAIEHNAAGEMSPSVIEYVDHAAGARGMMAAFGCGAEDLVYSQGGGWAVENVSISTHHGTHVDAPYHYGAISGDRPAKRIGEVPLEWCFGPGVVLDFRHKGDGELISTEDLQEALCRIGYRL